METIILGIIIIVSVVCSLLFYVFWQMERLPRNRPSKYQKQIGKKVVVLAGDSITHGQIGENYVSLLARRLDESEFTLVNAGINGQLAWNLLQRVEEIIECEPDYVTILIGTNDACAATSKKEAEDYVKRMKLPQMPDDQWFRECLQELVTKLQEKTSATIALISIPPIGEVSVHPAFRISLEYINLIQEVADITGVAYLPLHEKMSLFLKEYSGEPTYPFEKAKAGMFIACAKRYLLRREWNTIGKKAGFQLHIDYLHLNTTGAIIVSDLIERLVKSYNI
jgi:acyl-CoA thioesterase-1